MHCAQRGKAGKTTSVQSEGTTSSGHRNAVTEHKTKEYTIAAPMLRTGEAMENARHIRFWNKFSSQTNIKWHEVGCPVEKTSVNDYCEWYFGWSLWTTVNDEYECKRWLWMVANADKTRRIRSHHSQPLFTVIVHSHHLQPSQSLSWPLFTAISLTVITHSQLTVQSSLMLSVITHAHSH
jgi:hypothetical protein